MLGISVMGPVAAAPRFVLVAEDIYNGYCAKNGGFLGSMLLFTQ